MRTEVLVIFKKSCDYSRAKTLKKKLAASGFGVFLTSELTNTPEPDTDTDDKIVPVNIASAKENNNLQFSAWYNGEKPPSPELMTEIRESDLIEKIRTTEYF